MGPLTLLRIADIDRALHAVFGLQLPQLATDKPRITVEI
jgi:hypothetical protein